MGNKTSQNQNQNINSLASEVDDIALNYILTQNTIDLLRLTDKEYYDNLIILTSSVIEKRFNCLELGFLQQRIFGKQNDAMDIVPASNKIKEQVIFNISKFYIKIIMIYGAIATTIDPQYSYEVNGVPSKQVPFQMAKAHIVPILEQFKGWNTDTTQIKNAADLPATMHEYIKFINEYVGVPVKHVSNGPGRDQIVHL